MERYQQSGLRSVNLLAVCLALQFCLYRYHGVIENILGQIITELGLSGKSFAFSVVWRIVHLFLNYLILTLPAVIFLAQHRGSRKHYVRLAPTIPISPFYTLIFAVAMTLLTVVALDRISLYIPWVPGAVTPVPEGRVALLLHFLCVVFLPAFCAEPFFRGIVLHELLPFGRSFSIFASALTGAFLAQDGTHFVLYLVLGLLTGYFVAHTGSLWIGIFISLSNHVMLFLYDFVITEALHERFPEAFQIAIAGIFVLGVFSCLKIDDQITGSKVLPVPSDRSGRELATCLSAPCVVAYYIIICVNL